MFSAVVSMRPMRLHGSLLLSEYGSELAAGSWYALKAAEGTKVGVAGHCSIICEA